jgi:hypothetical protein
MAELEDPGTEITAEELIFFLSTHMHNQHRTYDTLMALLAAQSADKAKELYEIHKKGEFLFPPPWEQHDEEQ